MSILEVKNLCVSLKNKKIIKNISLSLNSGELCVLLGLNGSGKTTLLNALCGFNKYCGQVIYKDNEISSLNEKERFKVFSLIQQSSSLKDGFSSLEVVLMGYNTTLGLFSNPNNTQVKNAIKILEKIGLKNFIYRDFSTLSQGEKQLVILARCIIQSSPIMLMDEPDSALDFNNRHHTLSIIKEIINEKQYASLVTMHDPNFALKYADKIIILNKGEITHTFSPKTSNEKQIQEILSTIYKDIIVKKYSGGYLVGKNE